MWYVENINGDGTTVRKYFDTEQAAIDYSQWTAGKVDFEKVEENHNG